MKSERNSNSTSCGQWNSNCRSRIQNSFQFLNSELFTTLVPVNLRSLASVSALVCLCCHSLFSSSSNSVCLCNAVSCFFNSLLCICSSRAFTQIPPKYTEHNNRTQKKHRLLNQNVTFESYRIVYLQNENSDII